jgi:hypothetical protein
MKVLLKESQLNNAIERLIKSVNKNVVSVQFSDEKQAAWDSDTTKLIHYDKTIITVVLDPHDILGGNIHTVNSTGYIQLRKEIQKTLKSLLSINTTQFMSPYDIEYYIIGTTRV